MVTSSFGHVYTFELPQQIFNIVTGYTPVNAPEIEIRSRLCCGLLCQIDQSQTDDWYKKQQTTLKRVRLF